MRLFDRAKLRRAPEQWGGVCGASLAAIAGAIFVVIIGLAIWCLVRPEPLLVRGEAEST